MALNLLFDQIIFPGRKMIVVNNFTEVAAGASVEGVVEGVDIGCCDKFNIRQIGFLGNPSTDFDLIIGQSDALDFPPSIGAMVGIKFYENVTTNNYIWEKVGGDKDGLIFQNMDGISEVSSIGTTQEKIYFRFRNHDVSNAIATAATFIGMIIDY